MDLGVIGFKHQASTTSQLHQPPESSQFSTLCKPSQEKNALPSAKTASLGEAKKTEALFQGLLFEHKIHVAS
jgi:hypothetical protein